MTTENVIISAPRFYSILAIVQLIKKLIDFLWAPYKKNH